MAVTIAHEIVSGTMLLVHAPKAPANDDWNAYIEELSSDKVERLLVFTDGVGPNAAQRDRMHKRLSRDFPTAVVTPSLIARGIVTAISWLGREIRAFRPDELDDAIEYLRVVDRDRDKVLRTALGLRLHVLGGDRSAAMSLSLDEVRARVANPSATLTQWLRAAA